MTRRPRSIIDEQMAEARAMQRRRCACAAPGRGTYEADVFSDRGHFKVVCCAVCHGARSAVEIVDPE